MKASLSLSQRATLIMEESNGAMEQVKHPKKGGLRASIFTYGMIGLDTIGFSSNSANMVLYCLFIMHFDPSTSSTTTTNFLGTAFLLALLGGFVSDTYMNRLNSILISGAVQLLGYLLIILQSHYQKLQPKLCLKSTCVEGGQAWMFYSSLYLLALGAGGIKGALPSLGADQFDIKDPNERKYVASFFNWLLLCGTVGAAIGNTIVVWVSTNKGWDRGFIISMSCSFVGLIFLALGRPFYRVRTPGNSPLLSVLQVLVVMFKNIKRRVPEDADALYELHDEESVSKNELIKHTHQFRILDKAAIIPQDSKLKKWKVCTVTQVEEVKILTRMMPIILSTILLNTCLAQLQTFSVQQGIIMNVHLGSFKVPSASISVIPLIFMCFLIPVYEIIFVPFIRKVTGHPNGITHLQRVGVGLVISAVSMGIAGIVEVKRRNKFLDDGYKISLFWLGLQYAIFGIADMFTLAGLQEFFYVEAPASMKSLATSFALLSLAMGFYLSSAFVNIINSVTGKLTKNKLGWLEGRDMNMNRLELFYWFLAILSVLNFANYLFWANWYKYKKEVPVVISRANSGRVHTYEGEDDSFEKYASSNQKDGLNEDEKDAENNEAMEQVKYRKKGGPRATMCTYAMFLLDNIGFSANATNMVLYCLFIMHFDLSNSSTTTTNFLGTAFLLGLVGGFISDTYMNRLNTILVSGAVQLLGYILIILQSHYRELQPDPCLESRCVEGGQAWMFYSSLYMLALGAGGIKGSLPSLGADQFDVKDPNERKYIASFFNWLLLSGTIGGTIGATIVVWVSMNKGWDRGFIISMLCSFAGLIFIALGRPFYRVRSPGNSPLLSILQVLVVMFKNIKRRVPKDADELYELHDEESVSKHELIRHTSQFRLLDKAAIMPQDLELGKWNVCTLTQVEEVKILTRMMPIILSTILMNTCLAQLQTFSVQQGVIMNDYLGSFKVPSASISVIPLIFMCILIPLYEIIFVSIIRKITGHPNGITHLQRVGIGLVLSAVSMGIAGIVEVKRRNKFVDDGYKISLFWLGFHYGIFGIADMFTLAGLQEFFYVEAPARMRSLATSFALLSLSVGFYLSSAFVNIINSVTGKLTKNQMGWLEGRDMNKNRLELFYWFLAILSALNFANYLFWAKWYKYKKETPVMSRANSTRVHIYDGEEDTIGEHAMSNH
ncbi:hypothetical protein GIB67_034928 [Kingdonia uniflora]|uniref:Uncharacterized protein n=1 Tax=Kingdonia uniflora TaxID=39325 RepID=A0A7J7NGU7_9MAGN|nr:hypothetical protein GIB67_034928 [Kingdonia uniflora]